MLSRIRRLPSPALVISVIALIAAVGGGSFAIAALNQGKVKKIAKRQANKQIRSKAPGLSVNHANSADTATNADHATNADLATNAGTAITATSATSATSAGNAQQLGGVNPVVPATPMTLLNGWVKYGGSGYDTPAYWQDAFGVVHLKGSVAQPSPGSDVIFVLPAALRPSKSMNWPATLDSAHFGTIEIETNGDVRSRTFNATQATQAQTFTSMEGVSFRPTDP